MSISQFKEELVKTANQICTPGKGILAADESEGTIGKKFVTINVENNVENRQKYRELLFTAPGIEKYISGVIMFTETVFQKSSEGKPFPQVLLERGIISGIKVDKGCQVFNEKDESFTKGLDSLAAMCKQHYEVGCRFAKWRAVLKIGDGCPSDSSIAQNTNGLAQYALICQQNGLVPIVEPEILADGSHSIEVCQQITERVLSAQFAALKREGVFLEGCLLKPNMVTPGNSNENRATTKPEEIAKRTLLALQRTVPSALVGITFLSGGQSEEEASLNLNCINNINGRRPWYVGFSYGRALQNSVIKTWVGKDENIEAAQKALLARAKSNGEAQLGEYKGTDDKMAKETLVIDNYKY